MTLGRWQPRRSQAVKAGAPLLRPRKTGPQPQAVKLVPRLIAPRRASSSQAAALVCDSVQDWLQPRCAQYRCLHVPRPPVWGEDVQRMVDRLASAGGFGSDEALEEQVEVAGAAHAWDEGFAAGLSAKACRLASRATRAGLSSSLGEQIRLDVEEVGAVVAQMLPAAEKLILKLELLGENCCSRWHQDNYTARAIVTYNGCGTEWVKHDNVNFWELDNCGNNDHIVQDTSRVFSAKPTDVLFMKGKRFPGAVNGLVHKSPEKRYYRDGTVMTRLCLKVDVL